ncbi:uncharacterized protein KY384_004837 [Bacidia gigantensis]|uniref:uncharacterized protein n=1 Tax=Bacidia gigantensis TaxID=2732470 RepID=UPI001D050C1E|nr:uncharacterized protein KY384_004837 [Bacidia gigantensis]KAG8530335.1 hypothetical protein KY384_004837 [Bacidia gigantensis]
MAEGKEDGTKQERYIEEVNTEPAVRDNGAAGKDHVDLNDGSQNSNDAPLLSELDSVEDVAPCPRSTLAEGASTLSAEQSGTSKGVSNHSRKGSIISSLSIDTRNTTIRFGTAPANSQKSPNSPLSPRSTSTPSTKPPSASSPVSPRTRERGLSLRRSLLARTLPGHQQQPKTGTVVELQSIAGSSSGHRVLRSPTVAARSKKPGTSISVSPVSEQIESVEPQGSSEKKPSTGPLSLPNYESWASQKSTLKLVLSRLNELKEGVRKTILRIHELPQSRNGRHVSLDLARRKPLIDERRGHEYLSNTIRSSRYTLWNFIPRQLFAQFYKLANFYFLCVSILQMIPGLSTTGQFTTIVPLLFFVCISIAKEGFDDLRRYRLDKAENRRTTSILHVYKPGKVTTGTTRPVATEGARRWAETKWHDVKVGDVVKLVRDEAAPADLIVLQATGTEGAAYVETMALDGETNLKPKQPSPLLAKACETTEDITRCQAYLVVEDPNLDLYNFEGKVIVGEETLPLTNSEVIYRGSVLRNTREAFGMVIYTGEECKIRMNANKNPRIKAPALQFAVNRVVVIIVIFVIALAIFNTVAYQIWNRHTEDKSWYLTNAGVAFFPILASFIILFNTMIPLSLYVSLEIVKLCQMFLMNDIDMYDENTNTPMEARTSTINEELGQINYIFSDKTGTLTNNSMRFRKMSVAGTAWLHDLDLQREATPELRDAPFFPRKRSKGKKPLRKMSSTVLEEGPGASIKNAKSPVGRTSSVASRWKSSARPHGFQQIMNSLDLLRYVQRRPHTVFAKKVHQLLLSIALCHTCLPETKSDGQVEYQAASPDEHALVQAAQELGYVVIDRQNSTLTIKLLSPDAETEAVFEKYEVLDVIEFSSARKRMSIVVRLPNQRVCLFSKGADTTIMQLLRQSTLANAKAVEIEQRVSKRQSLEAQEAIRRASEARSRKDSIARTSLSIHRPSVGGITRPSMTVKRLQPIRDEVDHWLNDRERDVDLSSVETESLYYSPRPSAQLSVRADRFSRSLDGRPSMQREGSNEMVEEAMVVDDAQVFERCFQHINDFATEGLRTLLYGYRYMDEDEYQGWKKIYLEATTSLIDRQDKIEKAGSMIERDLELAGATAIEDKLQDGVPEAIDKLRRAKIKMWMLTGDKRETAINIGHSCRLIKDYSTITTLDRELGDVSQCIAAATLDISQGIIAHSVVVVDGQTLTQITGYEPLRKLFLSLAILADTVVCCRASPSQKASLVHSIRSKVKNAVTLAIGDGANDIAMIQEAHVGIGITGKEGLQAARTSDYSIAQFRFLTKLLLVHGRWNYIRTCKYTLGTFWKELLFYLTQALFQRYAGYTGTSLYESWSLSMFNTLFTSLPVIFMGVFEQDLSANTLMAVPELYHSLGPSNRGFNIPLYLWWVFMASSQAVVIFFIMLGLFGQSLFTFDNGLFAMGALSFTACIIVINAKIQFWELHYKSITCVIAIFLSVGGWFLWNLILASVYHDNKIYNVKDGLTSRFGKNALWWLTLILIVTACWAIEVAIKVIKCTWIPSDADCFRELEKDEVIRRRFAQAAGAAGSPSRPSTQGDGALERIRTLEEEQERENEVQELLNRPRHARAASGVDEHDLPGSPTVRRRQTSETEVVHREPKVSFAVDQREFNDEGGEDSDNGKQKPRRKSTEVQELLKRGFGNVRRSLDIV